MGYKIVEANEVNQNPNIVIGAKMPFNVPGVFGKSYTTLEQASTNIRCLLLTRKGERYIQPGFGTDLLNILFQPNISELKDFVSSTINDAVSYWLPYITITKLEVITQEDDPTLIHEIKIAIKFTVTGTDSEKTITIFAGENGIIQIE